MPEEIDEKQIPRWLRILIHTGAVLLDLLSFGLALITMGVVYVLCTHFLPPYLEFVDPAYFEWVLIGVTVVCMLVVGFLVDMLFRLILFVIAAILLLLGVSVHDYIKPQSSQSED